MQKLSLLALVLLLMGLVPGQVRADDSEAPPKRSILNLKGYMRLRGYSFWNFSMGVSPKLGSFQRQNSDRDNRYGYFPFPLPLSEYSGNSDFNSKEDSSPTLAGADMRLRIQPVIIPKEGLEIHATIDMLDNLVLGSTPDGYSGVGENPYVPMLAYSYAQKPPQYGVNSFMDSIYVRHVWANIRTPFGLLRFGRMPSQWGLGLLSNGGKGIDDDYGDSVDRVMFIASVFNHAVALAMDWVAEGPTSASASNWGLGQPYDLEQSDDVDQYMVAIARIDRGKKLRAMMEDGKTIFNYGAYFLYRTQTNAQNGVLTNPGNSDDKSKRGLGWGPNDIPLAKRNASFYIPDVWLRLLVGRKFRLELEAVAVIGSVENPANSKEKRSVLQWGAALETEFTLLNGDLKLGLWGGVASGDVDFWSRWGVRPDSDNKDNNFRFDPNYHVDMILWRRMYGTVTNAFYVRPWISYNIIGNPWNEDGLGIKFAAIYSQALDAQATLGLEAPLGVELNGQALYKTEDGYSFALNYGILFPLNGLDHAIWSPSITDPARKRVVQSQAAIAHTLQVRLGIQF